MSGGSVYSTEPSMHMPIAKDWTNLVDLAAQADGSSCSSSWTQSPGVSIPRWVGNEACSTPPLMSTPAISPYREVAVSPVLAQAEHELDAEAAAARRFRDYGGWPTSGKLSAAALTFGGSPAMPAGPTHGPIGDIEVVGRWTGLPAPDVDHQPTLATATPTTADTPRMSAGQATEKDWTTSNLIESVAAMALDADQSSDDESPAGKVSAFHEAVPLMMGMPMYPPLSSPLMTRTGMPTELPPRPTFSPFHQPPPPGAPPPPPPGYCNLSLLSALPA